MLVAGERLVDGRDRRQPLHVRHSVPARNKQSKRESVLRQERRAVHLVREQDVVRERNIQLEAALIALLNPFFEAAVEPGEDDLDRTVSVGSCTLEGRAWSGWAPITRVEISTDGGEMWSDAELEPLDSRWGWRGWRYEWAADEPGEYVLCCRAHDEAGNVQPLEGTWNVGGYSNNVPQRVSVTVQ